LEVGGGGTPPPEIFLDKKCYFSHISTKFEFIGVKKIGGSVPPPLGAPSPLKIFFCVLNSGWLDAFTGTLPWLDLVVLGQILAFNNSTLPW